MKAEVIEYRQQSGGGLGVDPTGSESIEFIRWLEMNPRREKMCAKQISKLLFLKPKGRTKGLFTVSCLWKNSRLNRALFRSWRDWFLEGKKKEKEREHTHSHTEGYMRAGKHHILSAAWFILWLLFHLKVALGRTSTLSQRWLGQSAWKKKNYTISFFQPPPP